jgi:hypothetical protein
LPGSASFALEGLIACVPDANPNTLLITGRETLTTNTSTFNFSAFSPGNVAFSFLAPTGVNLATVIMSPTPPTGQTVIGTGAFIQQGRTRFSPSEAGSFLVFPFWSIAGATNTTLCITDTADGPFGETATWVRLNFVCKGKKGLNLFCDEFDAHFPVTYHGTVCIDLKNDPRYTPPCEEEQGFAVAFAETANFVPQSHNTLIGHAQITAPGVLAEAKAVAVQSNAVAGRFLGNGTDSGALTFGPQRGPLTAAIFPGDYAALPDTLHGTFRASAPGVGPYTTLVILTLDTISGSQNPVSRIALDFWNANEVRYSAAHEFVCWDAVRLDAIDSRFDAAGLGSAFGSLRITAPGNCPIPGLCPPFAPFTPTILGTLVDIGPGAALGVRNLPHLGSRATTYVPEGGALPNPIASVECIGPSCRGGRCLHLFGGCGFTEPVQGIDFGNRPDCLAPDIAVSICNNPLTNPSGL